MTKSFKTLDDLSPKGKVVLLRGDLNVPAKEGKIKDATRLERLAPTIRELCDKGARVVLGACAKDSWTEDEVILSRGIGRGCSLVLPGAADALVELARG